jgi:lipid-A-disaccharide synthase
MNALAPPERGRLIMLVAGEPSGDALGARLMAALKLRTLGQVRFVGVGGELMAAQGLQSLFPMRELSVMGLVEVLPRAPRLVARLRETAAAARRLRPEAVVTIDSPGFSFRLARRLRGLGVPLIHYVAPTVWAWRPGRARRIARLLDHLLVLLPFEPPWFEREGLPTTFVGHPVVESGAGRGDGAAFRRRHRIAFDAPVLAILPGSRSGEVSRHLPVFGETLRLLRARFPGLATVLPTVPAVAAEVEAMVRHWSPAPVVVHDAKEKFHAFAAADAALAASGTVTAELALSRTPTVVTYRVNPASAWLARRLIKVRFVGLVNILLDRPVMPELLQEDCRPDRLAAAVERLLVDPAARQEQIEAAAVVAGLLGAGGEPPSLRAANAVLRAIALGPRRRGFGLPPKSKEDKP